MVDSAVILSNQNSMDIFPSFKSFQVPKAEQDTSTTDNKNSEEIQKATKSKQNKTTQNTKSKPVVQCNICSVPISSEIVYDIHIKGKKHQTLLTTLLTTNPQYKPSTYEELCSKEHEPVVENNQSEKSELTVDKTNIVPPLIPLNKIYCNICYVTCNSQQMYDDHIAGKRHKTKLKSANVTSSALPLNVTDNNPSSSNYCDICSLKLNTEDELTEHLAHRRHLARVKQAEICAKAAVDMNINFDDYKISITSIGKDNFYYQCTKCDKKLRDKIQLVDHLKSAPHIRLSTPLNKLRLSNQSNRGKHHPTQGDMKRDGTAFGSRGKPTFRPSNRSAYKSHTPISSNSIWNQPSQSVDQKTSNNIFGAFDPNTQSTFSSNNNYHSSNKRSTPLEEIPEEFSGFYPKRSRTHHDAGNNSQDFYTTTGNYPPPTLPNYSSTTNHHSPQITNYNTQSSISQQPWQYQTETYYDQQLYSDSGSDYTNPLYYSSVQQPLTSYEQPPPLPSYPVPSAHTSSSQSSSFFGSTDIQTNNKYYRNSFRH